MNKKSALARWEAMRDACLDAAAKIVVKGEEHRVQSLLVSAGIAEQNICQLTRSKANR